MEMSMRNRICALIYMLSLVYASSAAQIVSNCPRELKTFRHDLNSQCPFVMVPVSIPAIQVDVELLDKEVKSCKKTEYIAVLFHASWCPFSNVLLHKLSTLSSMYPQIKHLTVEQSSAMPSTFSKYGIHSVPSLLLMNQKARKLYHGQKDLQSLVNFYKRTTGLDPVIDMVEDTSVSLEGQPVFQLESLKEAFSREPYLVLSALFVFARVFMYFFPNIASQIKALWVAYVPRMNLGIFEESRQQIVGRVVYLLDIKRIWSKLKLCKTRNFQRRARNASVWASSLASVSLGEASSSRVFSSRDL